jgi:hypothetical protein
MDFVSRLFASNGFESENGLTVNTNNNRQYLEYSLSIKERKQLIVLIATFIVVFIDLFGVCATLLESCSGLIFLSLVLLTMVCAPLLVHFCQNINPLMRSSTKATQNLLYSETMGSSDNYCDRFSHYPNRFLGLFSC